MPENWPAELEHLNVANHRSPEEFADERPIKSVLITRVGAHFPRRLSYGDWEKAGRKLARIAGSTSWCLGDWLAFGERTWAGRYLRAVDELGLDYQTLRNYAWVSRRFEPRRRREDLSFQHHAEVAALPPAEQDRWLDEAQRQSWSRNQLRRAVRANRDEPAKRALRKVAMPRIEADRERMERWSHAAERAGIPLEHWIVFNLDHAATLILDKQ